jgi:hypothetical protein
MSDNNFSVSGGSASRRDANPDASEFDEIVALAREAGMLVVLDGRIGRETYQSVTGSLASFRRFAKALRMTLVDQLAA